MRSQVNHVVGNQHRGLGLAFQLAQVHHGTIGLRCHVEDVAGDFGRLVVFVAQLHVEDAHADLRLGIGIDVDGVVANLHAEFIHHVDGLLAVVLEGVALNHAAHFLRQSYVAGAAHRNANLTAFEQTVPDGEEIVVAVLLVDDGVSHETDILASRSADGSVQIAVVDGGMTAFVLHHHHGLVGFVGGIDFEIFQRDVVGLVECHHAVVLQVLVVAVAARGVVVVENLHVALSALALQRECVRGTQTLYIRYAYLFVIFSGLNLQGHRTFHAQCAEVVDGSLNRGIVAALAYGVLTALSAGNSDGSRCRLVDADGRFACSNAVQRHFARLPYFGVSLHVAANPEIVGAGLGERVLLAELLDGRECRGIVGTIDVVSLDGFAPCGEVERRDVERALIRIAFGLDGHLQHLHLGLSFQHFGGTDVLGGNTYHFNGLLLVALHLDGEVRTGIAAGTNILNGNLSAVLRGVGYYRVELSRRTGEVHDELFIVHLAALIYIKVCGVGKREALVGQPDAAAFLFRSKGDGAVQSVGTVSLRTAIVVEHGLLSHGKGYHAVVAFTNQNHILQRAGALGVAAFHGHVSTCIHADHLGIDGLAFSGFRAHVSLHGELIVALAERNRLAETNGHFG